LVGAVGDGREHAWASATIEHGEYKERLFVGCVGDKIIAYRLKTALVVR